MLLSLKNKKRNEVSSGPWLFYMVLIKTIINVSIFGKRKKTWLSTHSVNKVYIRHYAIELDTLFKLFFQNKLPGSEGQHSVADLGMIFQVRQI